MPIHFFAGLAHLFMSFSTRLLKVSLFATLSALLTTWTGHTDFLPGIQSHAWWYEGWNSSHGQKDWILRKTRHKASLKHWMNFTIWLRCDMQEYKNSSNSLRSPKAQDPKTLSSGSWELPISHHLHTGTANTGPYRWVKYQDKKHWLMYCTWIYMIRGFQHCCIQERN